VDWQPATDLKCQKIWHILARPTVWNSLSDDLQDPSVDSKCLQWDLKTLLFTGHRR